MATPRRLRMSTLLQTRDGTPSNKDARLTNVILEKNGDELDVLKRPGYVTYLAQATGTGQGVFVATTPDGGDQLCSIIDNTLYVSQTGATGAFSSPGNSNVGGAGSPPRGVLFFNSKYWLFSPGARGVYSSPTGAVWTQVTTAAAFDTVLGATNYRTRMGLLSFAGRMWVIGGLSSAGGDGRQDVYYSTDGSTWKLATSAAAFSARAPMGVLSFNNKMWILGGMTGSGASTLTADVYSSVDGITWTLVNAAPTFVGVYAPVCYSIAGKMFFAGGSNGSAVVNNVFSSSDGNTWTAEAAPAWSARSYAGAAVSNGFAYLALGETTQGSAWAKDIYRSTDGVNWTLLAANTGITGGSGASASGATGSNTPFPIGGTMVSNGTTVAIMYIANGGSSTDLTMQVASL